MSAPIRTTLAGALIGLASLALLATDDEDGPAAPAAKRSRIEPQQVDAAPGGTMAVALAPPALPGPAQPGNRMALLPEFRDCATRAWLDLPTDMATLFQDPERLRILTTPADWRCAAPHRVLPLHLPVPGHYRRLLQAHGGTPLPEGKGMESKAIQDLTMSTEPGCNPHFLGDLGEATSYGYLALMGYTCDEILAAGVEAPALRDVARILGPGGRLVLRDSSLGITAHPGSLAVEKDSSMAALDLPIPAGDYARLRAILDPGPGERKDAGAAERDAQLREAMDLFFGPLQAKVNKHGFEIVAGLPRDPAAFLGRMIREGDWLGGRGAQPADEEFVFFWPLEEDLILQRVF